MKFSNYGWYNEYEDMHLTSPVKMHAERTKFWTIKRWLSITHTERDESNILCHKV